eukprot:307016-Amorphochlora_amoeboformis.AAC.1
MARCHGLFGSGVPPSHERYQSPGFETVRFHRVFHSTAQRLRAMGNGCEVAFVVLLFLSARRGARGAVFSNCEAIECACPANETCSFASTGHDEFRGGILRFIPEVYLYGGSLTIDCTNWDE